MNLVIALAWAVEPLDFKVFLPAHVTAAAGADPEVIAPPEVIALAPPEVIALAPPEVIALAPPEVIALAPPEVIALAPPEVMALAPPEVIALPEVVALVLPAAALGLLLAALAGLELLLGEALLLLPHAESSTTHAAMAPAAMLDRLRLTLVLLRGDS